MCLLYADDICVNKLTHAYVEEAYGNVSAGMGRLGCRSCACDAVAPRDDIQCLAKCSVSLPRKGGNPSSRGLVIVRRSTLAQTKALNQASMNQKCVSSRF